MKHVIRLIGLTTLLLSVGIPAFAHGTSLKVDKATAAPGETITLKGEGVTGSGEIRLTLSGVRDYTLGTAKGDEHGRFEARVTLPADVRPGDYMVIAENEKRATAKLKVREGAPPPAAGQDHTALPPASREHMEAMGGTGGMEEMEKHAEAGPMEVERPKGSGEAAARWGIVLASVVLGLALRRGRRGRKGETQHTA